MAPLLRVGRSRRSPAGQCRVPGAGGAARRASRRDGSTGPSGSEGGTDRPCTRRGGTTLGGPGGTQPQGGSTGLNLVLRPAGPRFLRNRQRARSAVTDV